MDPAGSPANLLYDAISAEDQQHTPSPLVQYLCYQDDVLVPATEAANVRLRPLSGNSVRAAVTTVLQCVKREAASTTVQARVSSGDEGAQGGGGMRNASNVCK